MRLEDIKRIAALLTSAASSCHPRMSQEVKRQIALISAMIQAKPEVIKSAELRDILQSIEAYTPDKLVMAELRLTIAAACLSARLEGAALEVPELPAPAKLQTVLSPADLEKLMNPQGQP